MAEESAVAEPASAPDASALAALKSSLDSIASTLQGHPKAVDKLRSTHQLFQAHHAQLQKLTARQAALLDELNPPQPKPAFKEEPVSPAKLVKPGPETKDHSEAKPQPDEHSAEAANGVHPSAAEDSKDPPSVTLQVPAPTQQPQQPELPTEPLLGQSTDELLLALFALADTLETGDVQALAAHRVVSLSGTQRHWKTLQTNAKTPLQKLLARVGRGTSVEVHDDGENSHTHTHTHARARAHTHTHR